MPDDVTAAGDIRFFLAANAIAVATALAPVSLSEREIRQLIDFLHALTDPAMLDMRRDVPASVPSGLPLAD